MTELGDRERDEIERLAQMPKAIWRGVVKIQQEVESPRSLRVKRRGTVLVTSRDGSISVEWPSSRPLRKLLNSRAKAYFKATLLGTGKLNIREEVGARRW